jgi:hypothetical protein
MANDNQRIRYTKEQIEEAFNKGFISEAEAKEFEKQRQELIEQAKAERAKELKKKAALPPPKYYFDVKVECMLPATLTYRVYAETPQQAAEMIKGLTPTMVKHRLIGRKEIKLMVYDAGSSMIKFIKNLFGG